MILHEYLITGSSPDSETTAAVGSALPGMEAYDWFIIDAEITGSTNGGVTCTLQRYSTELDEWLDWIPFPTVAAGTTAYYSVQPTSDGVIRQVGTDTTVVLTSGMTGPHPGTQIRLVATGETGTDSAATQNIGVSCWSNNDSG